MRWQIEKVFQQITEVFALDQLLGCTPQATVFQASLCLVIDNRVQVLRGAIAAGRLEPTPVARLSTAKIFTDLHEELLGWHRTPRREEWVGAIAVTLDAAVTWARVQSLLAKAWTPS